MQIIFYESLPSTQVYLKELLKTKKVNAPIAITCNTQTQGIGSRENIWLGYEGNLFVSFALPLTELPQDLKLESASIYFAYLLKETLAGMGSKIWVKWPNDFYLEEQKIGGLITSLVKENIVCGFGLNLLYAPHGFGVLDIKIDKKKLLNNYFSYLIKKVSWKQVFSKYELEFHSNKIFSAHIKNKKIYLKDAILESDGSLSINGERMYSLR